MRKFFLSLLGILAASLFVLALPMAYPAAAQEEGDTNTTAEQLQTPLKAEAGNDKNAIVERPVLFDGSASTNDREGELTYKWSFGDGTSATGVTASHEYVRPGIYRANLEVGNGEAKSTDEIFVSVAQDLVVMITDRSVKDEDLESLQQFASTQEVLIVQVRNTSKDPEAIISPKLASEITEAKEDIRQASIIIVETSGNTGLNALSDFAQTLAQSEDAKALQNYGWSNKVIVVLGEGGAAQARIAQTTFNILKPQAFILTPVTAVNEIILAKQAENVITRLRAATIDYQIIGVTSQRALEQLTPFNFMSYAVNYLVNKGVPTNTILLILMLPLIATIMAIARQIGGIKAFGIYAPSIIALSFIVTGIQFGLLFFAVLLAVGTLTRILAKRFRMLYMPRIALVLTAVSFSILGIFLAAGYTGQTGLLSISIFPILIMTVMTEQFVAVQIEKGARTAIRLTVETMALSIITYYIVSWDLLKNLILGFPEIILLTIVINVLLGRWAGLRVSEYWRFRKVLKHAITTKNQ